MTQGIAKFLAGIRRKLFAARVDREVFFKIFPHLNQEADNGYPFKSDDEIRGLHEKQREAAHSALRMIERAACKMPKAYGDAFRYIAYRDINDRMWMYMELAAKRMQPDTCDPRCVATRATA